MNQKSEIKSLKERENRLLFDNTELDGENVQLQQQIVRLKEDLIELDTIRHENKALEENLDNMNSQLVEVSTLKRIVEKQLEESLNSFREEREHKYQKKRESHERREKQNLQELQIIAKDLNILNRHPFIDCDEDIEEEDIGNLNLQSNQIYNDKSQCDQLFKEMNNTNFKGKQI